MAIQSFIHCCLLEAILMKAVVDRSSFDSQDIHQMQYPMELSCEKLLLASLEDVSIISSFEKKGRSYQVLS